MPLPTTEPQAWLAPLRPPRRRRRRRAVVALLALLTAVLVAAPIGPAAGDDLSDAIARQRRIEATIRTQRSQIAALNRSQASLQRGIRSTKASLKEVNADLSVVASRIDQLGKDIALVKGRIHSIEAQAMELDFELATITVKQQVKADELQARKQLLADRIRNAYDTDRTPLLEAFLSSESFTDVLTEVGYQLDVAREDRALAEQIAQDQQTLATLGDSLRQAQEQSQLLRDAAASEKKSLDLSMKEMTAAQQRLKALQAETKRLLAAQQANYARMVRTESGIAAALARAQRAERLLEREIERLVAEQARQGRIPSKYNGALHWPMAGRVTQEFGCTGFSWEPPLGSCRHFHKGIDIAAPLGRAIHASGAGVVIVAGPNPYETGPNRAWLVAIAHSKDLVSWYGHVKTNIPVRVGQHVRAGQIIAYEGMTGRTTGPHLHWAVQYLRVFRNPRLFL
jgi:murein DD-endopeptidase MepM/ murein hydrolase activator NlpD